MKLNILLCLFIFSANSFAENNLSQYSSKDAYKYTFKAFKEEFDLTTKVKVFQKRTYNFLEQNLNETSANMSQFMVGSIAQYAMDKGLTFRGKNLLFSDRYELKISPSIVSLRMEGKAQFIHEKCKYWLLGGTDDVGAGIILPFDL